MPNIFVVNKHRTKPHQMFKRIAASSGIHLNSFVPLIESLFHLIAHPPNSLLQLINIIILLFADSVLYHLTNTVIKRI